MAWAKDKRYCTLVYLSSVKSVKPFNINKAGFGMACAWLTLPYINKIKIT